MDKIESLKRLKALLDEGMINEKEFMDMKNDLLADRSNDVLQSKKIQNIESQRLNDSPISKSEKSNNSSLLIATILCVAVFFGFKFIISDSKNNESPKTSNDNSTINTIVSKEDHLKTYDDWKKIADYKTEELYTCAKELINDDKWMQVGDICSAEHGNKRVLFRDGIEERSNLNYEDRQSLLKYWDEKFDITIKKIQQLIDENEMKKRPIRN
jgi:hypothetical protein